jgi:hypothetical protein
MLFPGMDPYLESPQLWPGVHSRLIVYIADLLQPILSPRYLAAVEERVYLERPARDIVPDVGIRRRPEALGPAVALAEGDAPILVHAPPRDVHETLVAILDRRSGERVVTVIEVVSPTNKYAGPGRASYLVKQADVLRSPTHLVEIDLLRTGPHVLAVSEVAARTAAESDYMVCVNRAHEERDAYELYPRRLRERLPRLRVPLAGDDPDVVLDLQIALAKVYESGAYAERLDYTQPCVPTLRADDQAWADPLTAANRRADGALPDE